MSERYRHRKTLTVPTEQIESPPAERITHSWENQERGWPAPLQPHNAIKVRSSRWHHTSNTWEQGHKDISTMLECRLWTQQTGVQTRTDPHILA